MRRPRFRLSHTRNKQQQQKEQSHKRQEIKITKLKRISFGCVAIGSTDSHTTHTKWNVVYDWNIYRDRYVSIKSFLMRRNSMWFHIHHPIICGKRMIHNKKFQFEMCWLIVFSAWQISPNCKLHLFRRFCFRLWSSLLLLPLPDRK